MSTLALLRQLIDCCVVKDLELLQASLCSTEKTLPRFSSNYEGNSSGKIWKKCFLVENSLPHVGFS